MPSMFLYSIVLDGAGISQPSGIKKAGHKPAFLFITIFLLSRQCITYTIEELIKKGFTFL
jgi:hypothetical protein